MNTDEKIDAVEWLGLYQPAFMLARDWWSLHWDRVPTRLLEIFKQLRSDDLANVRPDYALRWLS